MSEIHIKGAEGLYQALQDLPVKLERNILRGAMRAGAKEIEREAKALTPVADGKLRASIRVSVNVRRGQVKARIIAGNKEAWYAHMVEGGTAPHIIQADVQGLGLRDRRGRDIAISTANRAIKRGFLALGNGVFAESVSHPGAKPHPFMKPAFEARHQAAIERITDYIRARLDKLTAKS